MLVLKNEPTENKAQHLKKAVASILINYFENGNLQNAISSKKEQEFRDFVSGSADFI